MKNKQKGFAVLEIILIVFGIFAIASVGLIIYSKNNKPAPTVNQKNKNENKVHILSSEQAGALIETAKFTDITSEKRHAVYDHEQTINQYCMGNDSYGEPTFIDKNGVEAEVEVTSSISEPGYLILKYDYCEQGTQLYGVLTTRTLGNDGSGWHYVTKTDTFFKCKDLETYNVPTEALDSPECIDAAGKIVTYVKPKS